MKNIKIYKRLALAATIIFSILACVSIVLAIYTHITYGYVILN